MKFDTTTITKLIFWIGFGSFLATSIPHVAWLYQVYEPSNIYATITSYGIAIGIDVMIAWLSFICAQGKTLDGWITVAFIIALCCLSQYANFLYAMDHDPVHQADVWGISLFGASGLTTGFLTPMIISSVPFFSLAYTFMLSRLSQTRIDTAELEERLKNKKDALAIRKKYQADSNETFENKAKGALSSVIGVVRHGVNEVSGKHSTELLSPVQTEVIEESNDEPLIAPDDNPSTPQSMDGAARNVPLSTACELLQCEASVVKQLVSKGKLKAPNKSAQLVTMASINALLMKKQNSVRRTVKTASYDTDEIAIDLPYPLSENDQRADKIIDMHMSNAN